MNCRLQRFPNKYLESITSSFNVWSVVNNLHLNCSARGSGVAIPSILGSANILEWNARDDIQQGSKVSEWLYARFVTPIFIALFLVFVAFESVLQGGNLNWGIHGLIGSLLLLWPSILIVIIVRTYELVKSHTSKTAL
jgi:hypothetical protein